MKLKGLKRTFSTSVLFAAGCGIIPWLVAAAAPPSTVRTVLPTEISEPLTNPYMGWGTWVGPRGFGNNEKVYSVEDNTRGFGDDAPLFSWVLVDWDWASLEPQEGHFNWKDFDGVLSYWSGFNKQFVVRFWVTDDAGWNGRPGARVLPEWIWAKGMRYHDYTGNGGVKQRELDYADPSYDKIYLPALKSFLTAFAARYDKPGTPIIFLQVMGYGHWADWATWYSHYRFQSLEAKHALLAKIMSTYLEVFKNMQLFEFAGADWNGNEMASLEEHMFNKALDVAVSHGFGLIWTGFIDGIRGWDGALKEKYWRQNPIIAEGNWNYDDMMDQRTHGTLDENLELMCEWHANFAHFYFVPDTYKRAIKADRAFFERGLRAGGLGYRLVPTSMSWREELPAGDLLVVRQTWVNRGVGRLYVKHPLKLYLTDAQGAEKFSEVATAFDETRWLKGETHDVISVFHLPKELPAGLYDVRIALVDGRSPLPIRSASMPQPYDVGVKFVDGSGNPRIKLAIQGVDSEGRYRIGTIRILAAEGAAACDKAYCP